MQVVQTLADLQPWCLAAKEGQKEDFSVAEEVAQESASQFAGEVNLRRDGHVWVEVIEVADAPEPTTRIHVRCTN